MIQVQHEDHHLSSRSSTPPTEPLLTSSLDQTVKVSIVFFYNNNNNSNYSISDSQHSESERKHSALSPSRIDSK